LCDDPLIGVAGADSRWARRRKIDLAELIDEPWLLTEPPGWNYVGVERAFQARGLAMPRVNVMSLSVDHRRVKKSECSSGSPIRDRPRRRSFRCATPTAMRSTAAATPSNKAFYRVPHRRPLVRCAQIPIVQAAHPPFPHRGFLPWRISYAGPARAEPFAAAGIRNPSQNR
jgi:hypothetical protein